MKILPVETELFHADRRTDGWTDMTKLIVPFRNFVNAPKNCLKNTSTPPICFHSVDRDKFICDFTLLSKTKRSRHFEEVYIKNPPLRKLDLFPFSGKDCLI
jgi:hypothetical protein